MQIAPSTYYAARGTPVSAAELIDAYRANTVLDIFRAARGVYGQRKLWQQLRREGHVWGRDQVARLMGITGISGAVRGRRATTTTRRDPAAPRHPDLVQRAWAAPRGPDQCWAADFT